MRDRETDRGRLASPQLDRRSFSVGRPVSGLSWHWRWNLSGHSAWFRAGIFHVLRMVIKVMSSFCGCAPTKVPHVFDQSRDHGGSALCCARPDRLDHSVDAEFVPLAIQRLRHAVGVKNQTIVTAPAGSRNRSLSYRTRSRCQFRRPFRGA